MPEVWMRGPVDGISPLLQPVAHTLLQAQEEIHALLVDFSDAQLWLRPAGVAAVAFHLQHMAGVLDRLLTYAAGHALSDQQLAYLAAEGQPDELLSVGLLLNKFDDQIAAAIAKLKMTDEQTLTDARTVGRKQLPSTVMGLLFHAAEHTMRHAGQLLVTVRVIQDSV
ncbi:DinB superfamily protein [Chitinophaga sp. CF118]|uniref:DinB family protein n=1 Tax=Chitinophaga sp. CF118 TaxID=1884367 RepID=UPI0008E41DD2|nr:DinB family protein [Chitinophaga sp. CF118]SFD17845.1 DinB superfamily protein [Chitinophaga sp. CF118]